MGTRRASTIECEPTPTALALVPNGNYIQCNALWANNDGSCPTVQWVSFGRSQPVGTTNCARGWTAAIFNCNNPGGPDLTFSAYVRITDAVGTMVTPSTIPCGW